LTDLASAPFSKSYSGFQGSKVGMKASPVLDNALKFSGVPGSSTIGIPGPEFEPRFLEQTEAFFDRAAQKTGITQDYL